MKISIIIPTLNAEESLGEILGTIQAGLEKNYEYEVIILDSESNDNTVEIAKDMGAQVINIKRKEFNHGGTRNKAIDLSKGEFLVYLTQDALPRDHRDIISLIEPLVSNENIGMAYGRQIPHENAKIFGSFARLYNYGENSEIKSLKDKDKYGIKTIFCSNSFAVYRKSTLKEVGGFPTDIILGEDTYVCAKMLLKGYEVAYSAEAIVRHSHDYNVIQEFKRNFDIGVFHTNEKWLKKEFSSAEGEGLKFVMNEMKYLIDNKKGYLLLLAVMRNGSKFIGYKLGTFERYIPLELKLKMSMYKSYWNRFAKQSV